MALSKAKVREILSAAGVDSEHMSAAVDAIIDGNVTSIEALREDVAKYKADAGRLPEVQKELDDLKAEIAKNDDKNPYESKYNDLKAEYDKYKTDVEAKEAKAKKITAFRALAKEAGIGDKRLDTVVKGSDINGVIDAVELDKDGQIKGRDKLIESVKTEWADFITTTTTTGAQTANPPANNGSVLKSREEIYKKDKNGRFVLDASQRQQELSRIIAAQQQKGQ